jgi:protein CpxP
MKKLIAGVLLSTCIATAAVAGGKDCDDRRGEGGFLNHKMVKVLELSDAQKEQFKALKDEMKANRPAKDQMTPIRAQLAQLDTNDTDYNEEINALADEAAERAKSRFLKMAEMRVKISQILTPEQLEKFDEMAEERGMKGGKRGGKRA